MDGVVIVMKTMHSLAIIVIEREVRMILVRIMTRMEMSSVIPVLKRVMNIYS